MNRRTFKPIAAGLALTLAVDAPVSWDAVAAVDGALSAAWESGGDVTGDEVAGAVVRDPVAQAESSMCPRGQWPWTCRSTRRARGRALRGPGPTRR